MRDATKITTLKPLLNGRGYTAEEWEVGKPKHNPAGHRDIVERILIVDSFIPHAEITYEHFGEMWILSHITFIEYAKNREISLE